MSDYLVSTSGTSIQPYLHNKKCPYCDDELYYENSDYGSVHEFYGYLRCPLCGKELKVTNETYAILYLRKPE